MGCWIIIQCYTVVTLADDFPVLDNHATERPAAELDARFRQVDGLLHKFWVSGNKFNTF